jgi:lipopolysaccharide transport system ATP-binding protein
MSSDSIAIAAHQLSKTYRMFDRPLDRLKQSLYLGKRQYGREFHALTEVSFSLPQGQVMGLVGNNGAGKSTLLQLVCQTLKPTSGQLQVRGRVAALLELGAGFNPEFSGRENIYLNAAVLGLTREEIANRYEGIVEFSGVRDFIEQPVKTYSSGMYVRLAFSIATSVDPDILIIDEALSVGDGSFARKSFDRIMELKARGATILFCSHSMYHIEAICDQAMWLERGCIKMLGAPGDVTRAYTAQLTPIETSATQAAPNSSDTESHEARKGQARLVSVSASVNGTEGKFLKIQAKASTLLVDVVFQCDPSLPTPSIAFGIETLGGSLVSSGSSLFQGFQPKVDLNGCSKVRLSFPALPLMRGKYRLTIFLGCERTLHVYDHALYCAEIEVTQKDAEQGVVHLPHTWASGSV